MTKEWTEFFVNLGYVGLFLSLIPFLIALSIWIDLRFQAPSFRVIQGSGRKRRRGRDLLRVEQGRQA
jgi:hypothetical protein